MKINLADETPSVIDVQGLSYRYGDRNALHNLDLTIPDGAFYALLGPNGSGKTTLLQCLAGIRRAHSGRALVLGKACGFFDSTDRMRIGYVAEGQKPPGAVARRQDRVRQGPNEGHIG